jgi:hypothetical protein
MNQQFLIIWSALMVSQVIYLFVPASGREATANQAAAFPIALGIVAFAQAVGIIVLLKIRAVDPIQLGKLDPGAKEGIAKLFITLMLAWVLAESVAIYGLVLRFMHYDFVYFAPFSAAGAFLLFLARPWQSKLKKPLSSADLASSNAPLN